MESLRFDLRLAFRNLRSQGHLSLIIVLTLGVGIACTTAMFSVFRGVLLKPLPWPDADRLAVIRNLPPGAADPVLLSQAEVRDLQEMVPGLQVGSYSPRDAEVRFGDRVETLSVRGVTREVFELLHTRAAVGRVFAAEEYLRGGNRVVVLSHELWRRAFGEDPAAVGDSIEISGFEHQILGVLPPGFVMPLDYEDGEAAQLWIGQTLDYASQWPRQVRMFPTVARLQDGTSFEQARAELEGAMRELRRRHPEVYPPGWKMSLTPVDEQVLGSVRPALVALFGAVFFVLMIACANVAHLLLAQNDSRRHEMAVKAALGAARGRLVRQLMIENLLLALAGGVLGTLGAYAAVEGLLHLRSGHLPNLATVAVDPTVLLFGLAASLLTALVFGLVPALSAAGRELGSNLHQGRGSVGGLKGSRGRQLLMVAEVALATVLMAGASLLISSLGNLAGADLGFEPEGLTVASVTAPRELFRDPDALITFWDHVRAAGQEMPGVEHATLSMSVPFYSGVMSRPVEIQGGAEGSREIPRVTLERAGPDVAATLGYRLVRGRDLGEGDDREAMPVALVNETLARHLGDADQLRVASSESPVWLRVVGVVADARHESVDGAVAPRLILPYGQFPLTQMRTQTTMWLALRGAGDLRWSDADIRGALAQVPGDAAVLRTFSLADHLETTALARYRFATFLMGIFAAVALGLAVVGIYGLLSYLVTRGRREVGVRLALGARHGDIYRQVSRQGLGLALTGLALGLPGALLASGLLESLLYGLEPTDPAAFLLTALVLLGAALLGSLLPARRATEVQPIEVLRSE